MESPQELDLPSWHMLYSPDLEEERLTTKLAHPSRLFSLATPQKDRLSSAGGFGKASSGHEEGDGIKASGEETRKRDFFQLSSVHSGALQPCCVHLN